jgi:hypothetical protein
MAFHLKNEERHVNKYTLIMLCWKEWAFCASSRELAHTTPPAPALHYTTLRKEVVVVVVVVVRHSSLLITSSLPLLSSFYFSCLLVSFSLSLFRKKVF